MNTREYYVERFKAEKPTFVRVLRAVPPDKAAYRPHPRSASAGGLVWLFASELGDACSLVDRREVNFVQTPEPATLDESLRPLRRRPRHVSLLGGWEFSRESSHEPGSPRAWPFRSFPGCAPGEEIPGSSGG
jgi:hypothetical protein